MMILTLRCSFCSVEHTLEPQEFYDGPNPAPSVLPDGWRFYTATTPERVLPRAQDGMAEALHEAYDSAGNTGVLAPMMAQLEQYKEPLQVRLLVCENCVCTRSLMDIETKINEVRAERELRPARAVPSNVQPLTAVPLHMVEGRGVDDEDPPF